jgi:HAD superfamily hydrolase (TIGR01509 family)
MRTLDVDAVLLDMDGTLVDSDAAVERAWRAWAAEHGAEPEAVLEAAHGNPARDTLRRLLPEIGPEELEDEAARQLARETGDVSDVVPAVGADALLAALERLGLPWAVVTSSGRGLAEARLRAARLRPPLVVTFDDVRAGKPDPEGYLRAARLLGVDPARALVVEDSPPGVAAGRAAGARVAGLRGVPADVPVADLADVAALLEQVRAAA